MPNPPRRKRFQIHLSTAVVMMFVAGGLIWANVTPRQDDADAWLDEASDTEISSIANRILTARRQFDPELKHPNNTDYKQTRNGMPAVFCRRFILIIPMDNGTKREFVVRTRIWRASIALNLASGTFILFAIWFLCEWLIRRRAARAGR